MKELIYIVFFTISNFMLFYFNTKKIEISSIWKIILVLILFIILVFHFLDIGKNSITNKYFFHLAFISLVSLIFHYGIEFSILLIKKFDPSLENSLVITILNFWRFYVMYFFIMFYQIVFLFSRTI